MNQEEAIELLAKICDAFGWSIAIPNVDEEVPGVVIGKQEYIDDVLAGKYSEE